MNEEQSMKQIYIRMLALSGGKLYGTVRLEGREVTVEPFKVPRGTTPLQRNEMLIQKAREKINATS